MVNLPVIDTEGDLEWHNIENNSDANAENGSAEDVFVHPEFRLWLTTRTDIGFPLPAVIIHRGLKLACEAQESFGNAVRTNCQVATGSLNNGVPLWGEAAKGSVFMVKDLDAGCFVNSSTINVTHILFFFFVRPPSNKRLSFEPIFYIGAWVLIPGNTAPPFQNLSLTCICFHLIE